jgi:hypothetical protein
MDQIVKALGLINSFRIDGLTGSANPTSGLRLNLSGGLESLTLTAEDGESPGITITSQGFGIGNLSLPTKQNPSIALDPFLSHLKVDLHKELYERLAEFAKEAVLAEFHGVINRVVLTRLNTVVRMTREKLVHADVNLERLHLQHDDEELIRIHDLSLSLLDYNTKLPPKEAQKGCKVVLRSLRVEIEQRFFELVLKAVKSRIPSLVKNLQIELPGPKMIAGGNIKKGIVGTSFRVDLQLETQNDLFGIHFDRFYVPGTNMGLPDMVRNLLLSTIRTAAEKKMKGLVEVSNESIRINPWPKVPVELLTHVSQFAVDDGKIVVKFSEPKDRNIPPHADEYALAAERIPEPGDIQQVLAPGPAL